MINSLFSTGGDFGVLRRLGMRLVGLLCAAVLSVASQAVTLEEYGVAFTSTGLVDHVTQLQWLDSNLTQGTQLDLVSYVDDGWRLATVDEMIFLLSRDTPGAFLTSDLDSSAFLDMMERLGIVAQADGDVNDPPQPWLCDWSGADTSICTDFGVAVYVSFVLSVIPGDPVNLTYLAYLASYQIYDFSFKPTFPCLDCTGRSLMVRAVPVPAALWLMLGALAMPAVARVLRGNGERS